MTKIIRINFSNHFRDADAHFFELELLEHSLLTVVACLLKQSFVEGCLVLRHFLVVSCVFLLLMLSLQILGVLPALDCPSVLLALVGLLIRDHFGLDLGRML